MNPTIEQLTAAVEQEAKKRPEVLRLMTHPGVGPLTALAFVLIIGTPERFRCGQQIGSREFEVIIMVEVLIGEMFGSNR